MTWTYIKTERVCSTTRSRCIWMPNVFCTCEQLMFADHVGTCYPVWDSTGQAALLRSLSLCCCIQRLNDPRPLLYKSCQVITAEDILHVANPKQSQNFFHREVFWWNQSACIITLAVFWPLWSKSIWRHEQAIHLHPVSLNFGVKTMSPSPLYTPASSPELRPQTEKDTEANAALRIQW